MTTLLRQLTAEIGEDAATRACDIVQDWLIQPQSVTAVSLGIGQTRTAIGHTGTSDTYAAAGLAVLSAAVVDEYTKGDTQSVTTDPTPAEVDLCGDILDDNTRCAQPAGHEWHRNGPASWIHEVNEAEHLSSRLADVTGERDDLVRDRDRWRTKHETVANDRDEWRRKAKARKRRLKLAEQVIRAARNTAEVYLNGKPEELAPEASRLAGVIVAYDDGQRVDDGPQTKAEYRQVLDAYRTELEHERTVAADLHRQLVEAKARERANGFRLIAGEVLLANAEADLRAARAEIARLHGLLRSWREAHRAESPRDLSRAMNAMKAAVDALDQPAKPDGVQVSAPKLEPAGEDSSQLTSESDGASRYWPGRRCKTCKHPAANHHNLHCEVDGCDYCNGWTCPTHDLVLCGCTYAGGPTPKLEPAGNDSSQLARWIAPWTDEQVEALRSWQRGDTLMHPYTCCAHTDQALWAEPRGWRCPVPGCDYEQNWAWAIHDDSGQPAPDLMANLRASIPQRADRSGGEQ